MGRTSHMDASKVVIQMKDIVKKFGDFTANDHINLTVHKGEVHAIFGENGAGKSTMMNVLCGLYKPTSGQIFINEKEVHFNSPKDAIDMGIGMVHQHFMLIQPFTVTENIILGMEPVKGLTVDKETAKKKVLELSEALRHEGRSGRKGRGYLRWHAAACGDPEGAVPRRGDPDPGRADRVPDSRRRSKVLWRSSRT